MIGAGQAGLAAGRELRMAGHDVLLLLEAHPRLGES
ncbi:NAD(P)-binding protein [Streptosporangium sp. NPDC000239]